jgi:hypothetical protein
VSLDAVGSAADLSKTELDQRSCHLQGFFERLGAIVEPWQEMAMIVDHPLKIPLLPNGPCNVGTIEELLS